MNGKMDKNESNKKESEKKKRQWHAQFRKYKWENLASNNESMSSMEQ